MPRGPRLTHKDIAEINRLLGEGLLDAEIARRSGRSRQTVAQLDARVGDLTEALTNFINVARRRTLADLAFPEADQ